MNTRTPRRALSRAKAPLMLLDQDGWLYVPNLMHLFQCSHQTVYSGIRSGKYPKPDGFNGRRPYWNTSSLRPYFRGGSSHD